MQFQIPTFGFKNLANNRQVKKTDSYWCFTCIKQVGKYVFLVLQCLYVRMAIAYAIDKLTGSSGVLANHIVRPTATPTSRTLSLCHAIFRGRFDAWNVLLYSQQRVVHYTTCVSPECYIQRNLWRNAHYSKADSYYRQLYFISYWGIIFIWICDKLPSY